LVCGDQEIWLFLKVAGCYPACDLIYGRSSLAS
jgi:hypothetical protein